MALKHKDASKMLSDLKSRRLKMRLDRHGFGWFPPFGGGSKWQVTRHEHIRGAGGIGVILPGGECVIQACENCMLKTYRSSDDYPPSCYFLSDRAGEYVAGYTGVYPYPQWAWPFYKAPGCFIAQGL